jgi:Fis family transcriptional regulator
MKPVELAAADEPDSKRVRSAREQDQPLAQCVAATVRRYLDDLGDHVPSNLHQLLLEQVEKPLLTVVMERARGNRCRAAELLGINRNTLRKKLQQYGL